MLTWREMRGMTVDDFGLVFDDLPERKKAIIAIVIPNYRFFLMAMTKGSIKILEEITDASILFEKVDEFLSSSTQEELMTMASASSHLVREET